MAEMPRYFFSLSKGMGREDSEYLKYIPFLHSKKLLMFLKLFQESDNKYEEKFGKRGP